MATEFLTSFTRDYYLTSDLYSVRASTDKTKVAIEIIRDPDGDIDSFFSTVLYPHAGIVELSDIGSLIEDRLREVGKTWDTFDIVVDGITTNFMAIYCEYHIHEDFDPDKCFFSIAQEAVVCRDSPICLRHLPTGSGDYRLQAVGHAADGKIAVFEHTISDPGASGSIGFMTDYIIALATGHTEEETDGSHLASVSYFAISHGLRQKLFYIADHTHAVSFIFRNMFNAPEYLDIPGTVTRKTKFDSATAVCSGHLSQYDRSVEQTFEFSTGPLSDMQIRLVEQLIGSRDIRLCVGREEYPVIVTDHTIESSDSDENMSTVSFTFRFTSQRITITPDEMNTLRPVRTNIFSPEYAPEFA